MPNNSELDLDELRHKINNAKIKDMRNKYRMLFGTEVGKQVLEDMVARAKLGESAFDKTSLRNTDFVLGGQNFMLSILNFMDDEVRPESYFIKILRKFGITLIKEKRKEENEN